jgi:hypothetical protein
VGLSVDTKAGVSHSTCDTSIAIASYVGLGPLQAMTEELQYLHSNRTWELRRAVKGSSRCEGLLVTA